MGLEEMDMDLLGKGFMFYDNDSLRKYYKGKLTIQEIKKNQNGKKYPGNAPPMRAIPLGFTGPHMYDLCINNANTTHPHPKAIAASVIIALATKHFLIDRLSQQTLFPTIIEELTKHNLDEETINYLKDIDTIEDYHQFIGEDHIVNFPNNVHEQLCGPQPFTFHDQPVYGLYSDSMRTAGIVLYILKHYKTPFDALKVSMWVGGDVDSLGSIVLGIVGAKDGLVDIPPWMTYELEAPEYLISIAEGFKNWVNDTNFWRM